MKNYNFYRVNYYCKTIEIGESDFLDTFSSLINQTGIKRKALFLVISDLLQTMPADDPVSEFLDKKRAEGKPYYVYMTAVANNFLLIYYGRVREYKLH